MRLRKRRAVPQVGSRAAGLGKAVSPGGIREERYTMRQSSNIKLLRSTLYLCRYLRYTVLSARLAPASIPPSGDVAMSASEDLGFGIVRPRTRRALGENDIKETRWI